MNLSDEILDKIHKGPDISLTGNNDADIFEITNLEDGTVRLKVGHNCVFVIDHIVPVEFLTALLVKAIFDNGGVVESIQSVEWPEDFKASLVEKIEPFNG